MGENLAVRQNLEAESSRNENESIVCVGSCGAGKFCLTHKYTHSFAPKSINLQSVMLQTIKLKLVNENLHIGLVDWRQVYVIYPQLIQLNPEVDRGRLVYRAKGSKRRISYLQIKKGLIKKNYSIQIDFPEWFFK